VIAVEPSEVMVAQRPDGAAPVVRAFAEQLPFDDGAFDAAMAVLSDHHWSDHEQGLAEMRRVAGRVVLFTWDPATTYDSWLVNEYFRGFKELVPDGFRLDRTAERLGGARIEPVAIPHDCRDGFLHAYWRRPHAYLDPRVRDGISVFRLLPHEEVEAAMAALRADLESGEWERRNASILELDELDLGYRLVVADY
jgi:SAM-dependent methyltransferase